jgi:hypothetical protein
VSARRSHDPRAGRALALLFLLAALLPAVAAGDGAYKRPGWADMDKDCRDTRAEVLAAQCRVTWAPGRCKVARATCMDPYSGAEVSADTAAAFHADHVYPAAEAWKRRAWKPGEFKLFFNWEPNLLAVRARTNLRKGDAMPQEWCPTDPDGRRDAARVFRLAARTWALPIRPAEEVGLRAWERGECAKGARQL